MDIREESLKLHYDWNGKIEVISRVPISSSEDLALAYTPGVAEPCLEVQKDINKSYELTRRNNQVAVVTDGTGTDAAIEGYDAAGKTSTAEIYDEKNGGYLESTYNLGFIGFLPNSTSNLVCFVNANMVPAERPVTFVFHDIMEDAVNRYNITERGDDS